ncbi:MAG: hypothetical protein KKD44_17335 [Proteobacteria bacterium]|nr:hypothetical protein [Pseudomonadota bacterium]
MKYLNLTRQKLILPDGTLLEPSGTVAHVKDTTKLDQCGTMTLFTGKKTMTEPYKNSPLEKNIPLFKSGAIILNLPKEKKAVKLIVSKDVLTVGKGNFNRKDLLAPVLSSVMSFYMGQSYWQIPGFYC